MGCCRPFAPDYGWTPLISGNVRPTYKNIRSPALEKCPFLEQSVRFQTKQASRLEFQFGLGFAAKLQIVAGTGRRFRIYSTPLRE